MLSSLKHKFRTFLQDISDFQGRVWVVHIKENSFKDESFVINEDNFRHELQWMKNKNYSQEMLNKVNAMKPSQILVLQLGNIEHQLMRVK